MGGTSYKFYARLTDEAIKSSNQKGVEILFKSISYFDHDYQTYEHVIEVAAEHSDMATFSYILYANIFDNYLGPYSKINTEKLVDLSEKNSHNETREFILRNIKNAKIWWIFE